MTQKSIQRSISYLIASLLILSLLIAPAAAHGVYMSYEYNETDVSIKAWYQGGDPMADCDVQVTAEGVAAPDLNGKTNANGEYSFKMKDSVKYYNVKVVEGEHAIEKKIDITSESGSASGGAGFEIAGIPVLNLVIGLLLIIVVAGAIIYFQKKQKK
jgi:hypothetical protein